MPSAGPTGFHCDLEDAGEVFKAAIGGKADELPDEVPEEVVLQIPEDEEAKVTLGGGNRRKESAAEMVAESKDTGSCWSSSGDSQAGD